MPPKTKSKKPVKGNKSKKAVKGKSTEEMPKDQLEEHIVRLREELDRKREERDKIQAFWEISKRRLEEQKAQLRSRHVEREEAEERYRVEITVYKQKLRHVLSEHHGTISGLKVDAVASTMLVQNQHTQSELGLQRDLHDLQADFREKKFHNENNVKELKLKHQVELMELANNRDKIIRDMVMKYHEKRQSMTEAEAKKRRAEVNGIEYRMKNCVETLIEEHDRAIRHAGDYYSALQQKLPVQNNLKDELANKKLPTRVDKKFSAAEQENKRLSEALQEAQQKLPELQKQQHDYKQKETKIMARVKVLEKELRDLSMEHELLLQAFGKVQQERDDLLQKQTGVILDIQQKSGLKQLLLERKLAALTKTVEKKEAQLCAALSASNIDQTAGSRAANKVQGMLESKQATIDPLQSDLARDCAEDGACFSSTGGSSECTGADVTDGFNPEQTEEEHQRSSDSDNTDILDPTPADVDEDTSVPELMRTDSVVLNRQMLRDKREPLSSSEYSDEDEYVPQYDEETESDSSEEEVKQHTAKKRKEYDNLLQTCKERLKYWKVPLYKFPFRPSERLLGGQARVQDSPGPAASKQ